MTAIFELRFLKINTFSYFKTENGKKSNAIRPLIIKWHAYQENMLENSDGDTKTVFASDVT